MSSDPSRAKRDDRGMLLPGHGMGRPKGSRNKLATAFFDDLYHDWQENGAAVLEKVRKEAPDKYLRTVASLMPQKLEVERSLGALNDDELENIVAAFRAAAGEAQAAAGAVRAGDGEAPGGETPGAVPPLH